MPGGIPEPMIILFFGFVGGMVLGLAARVGRFCTLGAIEDLLYQQSDTRLRMWGLAIGVAGITAFGLAGLDLFDISANAYWITPCHRWPVFRAACSLATACRLPEIVDLARLPDLAAAI